MRFGRMIVTAGGAAALAGMVALGGPAAWAQDATPEAAETASAKRAGPFPRRARLLLCR